MKRSSFLSSLASLALFGSFFSAGSLLHAEEITVYSHRHYPSDQQLFDKFTEQTGIEVKVVKAKANELIERLKAEGENTPADVFITADASRLHVAKEEGLLKPIDSSVLKERVPENLRDENNSWFGFTKRARIIAYAKDRVKPEELSTYEALAEPQWRARIVVRSSGNIYNQSLMSALLETVGEEAALKWAMGVRENMARPPQGNDRDQLRAVAKGIADVAIVNTYYVGLLANSEDAADREVAAKVGIFFPNQDGRGTHVNISGGGVVTQADNPEGAQKFLEFLISDEAQQSFPLTTSEYPVVEGIEWTELMKSWGEFKEEELSLGKLGARNVEAIQVFNKASWE